MSFPVWKPISAESYNCFAMQPDQRSTKQEQHVHPKGVYRTPAQRQHPQYTKRTEETKPTRIATPFCRPKGPCYNCGAMGHYAADCIRYKEPSINYMDEEETSLNHPDDQSSNMSKIPNYMDDEDPEMDQIPDPII